MQLQEHKQTRWGKYKKDIRSLFRITTPIWIAQLAPPLMGMLDTIMAGRVSADDMAAVSVGASIWFPLVLFGQGLLLAIPPTISYLNGSNQRTRIAHQVRQGLWIIIGVSIPLTFLLWKSPLLIHRMGMESHLAEITIGYIHAMMFGLIGYLLMINFRGLNEGIAKTKPAMVIAFLGVLANIPLNYIFIYGKFGLPAFGGVGCGIATAIVNWIMGILMIIYCRQARSQRDLKVFDQLIERPNPRTIAKLIKLGLPVAIALCCEVALFAIVSLLLSPLGSDVVASHQIALNTSSFVFIIPLSLGMATTILVSQRLGEKQFDKAKQIAFIAIAIGLVLALVTASLTILFRKQIALIFISGENVQVITMAGTLLLFAALYQFSDTVQVICNGALRGYKDTKAILYITLFSYWGVGFTLGYTLGLTDWLTAPMAAKGFWIGFIASLTTAAFFLISRLRYIQSIPHAILEARLEKIK